MVKDDVVEILSIFHVFADSGPEFRKEIVGEVLRAIRAFSDKGEGNPDNAAGEELYQDIMENYDIMGVVPNITYEREKGSKEELNALWVHPFASFTLYCKHKRLPEIKLVNPGIRLGKSFLKEMPKSAHAVDDIEKTLSPAEIGQPSGGPDEKQT